MARVHDDANASLGPSINHVVLVGGRGRVRPRFFDQVGHETMYASSVGCAIKDLWGLCANSKSIVEL